MAAKNGSVMTSEELAGLSIHDKVTLTSVDHADAMMKSMYSAYKEGRYCDTTICIDDKKISCHRLVLSGLSDYFKILFEMDKNETNEFTLHDIDFDDFQKIVEFAYTGKLQVHQGDLMKMMISVNFFQISSIQSLCEAHMLKSTSAENCVEYLIFADTYGLKSVRPFCMNLLQEQFEVISATKQFLILPPDILIEIMNDDDLVVCRKGVPILSSARELVLLKGALGYIDKAEKDKISPKEILDCVRFPQIKHSHVVKEIKKWPKIKSIDEVKQILELLESRKEKEYPRKWNEIRKFTKFSTSKTRHICAGGGQVFWSSETLSLDSVSCEDIPVTDCIKSLKIFLRTWDGRLVIGGILVEYTSGTTKEYGGKATGDRFVKEVLVELNRGEMITAIKGSAGWVLDQLTFETSEGRQLGAFGGSGGANFNSSSWNDPKAMFLHGFNGTSIRTQQHPAVVELGFIWKYYDTTGSLSTSEAQGDNKQRKGKGLKRKLKMPLI